MNTTNTRIASLAIESPKYGRLTAEDVAIMRRNRRRSAAVMIDDMTDADLMHDLMPPAWLGRATRCPLTLATVGLEWPEVQRIARELRTGITVDESGTVEHVELCSHGLNAEGYCEDCAIDAAEHNQVPADWFAGGFADNH